MFLKLAVGSRSNIQNSSEHQALKKTPKGFQRFLNWSEKVYTETVKSYFPFSWAPDALRCRPSRSDRASWSLQAHDVWRLDVYVDLLVCGHLSITFRVPCPESAVPTNQKCRIPVKFVSGRLQEQSHPSNWHSNVRPESDCWCF